MRPLILPALTFLIVLIAWETAVHVAKVPIYLLPAPSDIAKAFIERGPSIRSSLAITATGATAGLLAAAITGVLVSMLFAQFNIFRRAFYAYTTILPTVPILAIAPLIILWLKPGLHSVILIAAWIAVFPIIVSTTQGLLSVDRNMLNLFRLHKATPLQILLRLRLPNALPGLFAGLRISSSLAVIGAFVGETYASSTGVGEGGLGYAVTYALSQLQTGYLFALVATSGALGLTFFLIALFFEWFFLHTWHESAMKPEND